MLERTYGQIARSAKPPDGLSVRILERRLQQPEKTCSDQFWFIEPLYASHAGEGLRKALGEPYGAMLSSQRGRLFIRLTEACTRRIVDDFREEKLIAGHKRTYCASGSPTHGQPVMQVAIRGGSSSLAIQLVG